MNTRSQAFQVLWVSWSLVMLVLLVWTFISHRDLPAVLLAVSGIAYVAGYLLLTRRDKGRDA